MEYIINWIIIPGIISALLSTWLAKRAWKKLEQEATEAESIDTLVSTEKQGDYITVCFKMKSEELRYFKVKWLDTINIPNEVIDLKTFKSDYGDMAEAAKHAACIHMGSYRTPLDKNVYDSKNDWRLLQ